MEQAAEKDSEKQAKTEEKGTNPLLRGNPTGTTDPNPNLKTPPGAGNVALHTTVSDGTTARPPEKPPDQPGLPVAQPKIGRSEIVVSKKNDPGPQRAANTSSEDLLGVPSQSSKPVESTKTSQNPVGVSAAPKTAQTSQTRTDGNDRATGDGPPQKSLTAQLTLASSAIDKTIKESPAEIVEVKQAPIPSSGQPSSAPTSATQPPSSMAAAVPKTAVSVTMPPATVQVDLSNIPTESATPNKVITQITAPSAAVPSYQSVAHQAVRDAAIDAARRPLTNLYGAYLCKSKDASLQDARERLKKAIAQTCELRQAFTDRVYEKYRVCLKPPPSTEEILTRIYANPEAELRRLKEEEETMRAEKEIEKKEASKLNEEMAASASGERVSVLPNVDNADQVMYLTAGLNLVILPEEKADPADLRNYADRAPIDHITGQRSRNLSHAAAMAGEVILDRTRKAAAMRVERKRRSQLKLLRGETADKADTDNNYSRLQILSENISSSAVMSTKPAKGSVKTPGTKPVPQAESTSQSSKSARSRSQTTLSTSVLLSLHATADQVKPDGKPKAATVALMTRGIGSAAKTTQQRLKHPHPDSLGGRRRASVNPVNKKDTDSSKPPEPFQEAFLANTLPPLPASKERTERKPLPVLSFDRSRTSEAQLSVRNVLQEFVQTEKEAKLQTVQKISFLNSLRKLRKSDDGDAAAPSTSDMNPTVTISVMHALGLLTQCQEGARQRSFFKISNQVTENKALYSEKFKSLCSEIGAKSKLTTTNLYFGPQDPSKKRDGADESGDPQKKARLAEASDKQDDHKSVPVASIRGGGEVLVDAEDSKPNKKQSDNVTRQERGDKEVNDSKKRKRSESSPETLSSPPGESKQDVSEPKRAPAAQVKQPSGSTPLEQFHAGTAANAYHFAAQLGPMHHPAAGDLTGYLGGLQQQQGYALPGIMSNATQAQLSALGFGQQSAGRMGYAMPDGAAAARAMLLREQQAAALLGYQPPAGFSHVGPHAAAMSAFLGVQSDPTMLGKTQAESTESSPNTSSAKKTDPNKAGSKKKSPETQESSRPSKRPRASSDPKAPSSKNPIARESEGMKLDLPSAPEALPSSKVDLIRSGRFHLAVTNLDAMKKQKALDYLLTFGTAIPIPKNLILGPLTERLETPGFKDPGNSGIPQINRDVVAATILVWLWNNHQRSFQQAIRASARVDEDHTCKWLMQAAIDAAVGELALEIANLTAKGEGVFAEAVDVLRKDASSQGEGSAPPQALAPLSPTVSKRADVCSATVVSRALNARLEIDGDLNSIFPKYQQFVELLDSTRLGALRAKSQERTLLATLVTRKSTMTENFANAYVSSMVRAGEALGHDHLFETVQDEPSSASTMMPYDIFTDETGSWEDPCRPESGFSEGLTGDDLYRRAHGRAMIQKSLKKLQDKHQIRGGTTFFGPFVDPSDAVVTKEGHKERSQPLPSPRYGGGRRRASSMTETIPPGTGSAPAASWATYEPQYICSPLDWDVDDEGNTPYGVHTKLHRKQSLSLSGAAKIKARSMSLPLPQNPEDKSRSTNEIDWKQVASIFRSVELPEKSSKGKSSDDHHHAITHGGPIVAPLCRVIEGEPSEGESDSTETEEEDLSEEAILARHQVVLDEMKGKLDAFLEARKQYQDRRKSRTSKG